MKDEKERLNVDITKKAMENINDIKRLTNFTKGKITDLAIKQYYSKIVPGIQRNKT